MCEGSQLLIIQYVDPTFSDTIYERLPKSFPVVFIYLSIRNSRSHVCNTGRVCEATYYCIRLLRLTPLLPCVYPASLIFCMNCVQCSFGHRTTFLGKVIKDASSVNIGSISRHKLPNSCKIT